MAPLSGDWRQPADRVFRGWPAGSETKIPWTVSAASGIIAACFGPEILALISGFLGSGVDEVLLVLTLSIG